MLLQSAIEVHLGSDYQFDGIPVAGTGIGCKHKHRHIRINHLSSVTIPDPMNRPAFRATMAKMQSHCCWRTDH